MAWALDPVDIEGKRVRVRNYTEKDFTTIAEAINDPKGWFGKHWGIDSPQKVQNMLDSLLQAQGKGLHNTLVYYVGDEVAGITRLMRLEPSNKSLEIGGTWVAPKWRKSFVNTEVKFLLLKYCFENLLAERVEFRVDGRNIDSQRAVLRIGAKLEGRLRTRQIYPDGVARDGFLFSVIRPEWAKVKENLEQRISDPSYKGNPKEIFPSEIETSRLLLRRYKTEDAEPLFRLIDKNRADLWESFPLTFKEIAKREDTDVYILNKLHQWITKVLFCYVVIEKETGQQVGQFHIKNIKWEIPSAEFGYFFDINHQRKGYGAEILEEALELCLKKQEMKRVFLRILPNNHASLRLAEKLKFEYEGLHKKEFVTGKNELVDVCYFSKTSP